MQPQKSFFLLRRIPLKHVAVDLFVVASSLYASLFLRAGLEGFKSLLPQLTLMLPVIILIRIGCLVAFRCYLIMWRYISAVDASRLIKALALSGLIIVALTFFLPDYLARLPRAVYIIDTLLVSLGLMGVRLLRRFHFESKSSFNSETGQTALIYGSGHNGRLLAQRFKTDRALGINLVGFIDDDPKKKDIAMYGVPVLGTLHDLSELIEKFRVTQLIVAIPGIRGEVLRDLVQITRPYGIRPRLTASLAKDGALEVHRDIELSDLLNRSRRELDMQSVRELIRGKRVLVTGAGGSIGSELARQIMAHEPSRLMLLDHSEYNLYEIDQELRLSANDTERVVPLLLDLKDVDSLRTAMREYVPEVVFHAAAYKHVHLVESNPYPAILNNVEGTRILLDLCSEIGVSTFVMISTDKAVNPAGVMGATKRVCELLVTLKALTTRQRYCSVRFGNVLGSSGSLIPLLQKQISQGGPVTVTHPDMTRFFMLIPEAVSLVLQAATFAQPGDINVLKMGEPVRILEIAKSLIALFGKSENEIPIVYTGLRPGEKMFEELYIRGDELKTEHADILTLPNGDSQLDKNLAEREIVSGQIEKMILAARRGSKEALFELNELVKSAYFKPDLVEKKTAVPLASSTRRDH